MEVLESLLNIDHADEFGVRSGSPNPKLIQNITLILYVLDVCVY